jgi:hypothetical protein
MIIFIMAGGKTTIELSVETRNMLKEIGGVKPTMIRGLLELAKQENEG